MKKLALVVALTALCSFGLAQQWEYAIYQVFERSAGWRVHAFFDRTGHTGGHSTVEELFAALGARVSTRSYGTNDLVAALNFFGFRGWEVWRVTEQPEPAGVMVSYFMRKPR